MEIFLPISLFDEKIRWSTKPFRQTADRPPNKSMGSQIFCDLLGEEDGLRTYKQSSQEFGD